MNYNEWKQMQKTAGWSALGKIVATGLSGMSDVTGWLATSLLAAAAGIGGAAGFAGAKLNAHDKQDIDTIQKEYENERLKADLGYLQAKLNNEYAQSENASKPKAARIFA